MIILGIDPGPTKSGIAAFNAKLGEPVRGSYHHLHNDHLLELIWSMPWKAGELFYNPMSTHELEFLRTNLWVGNSPDAMAFEMPQYYRNSKAGQSTMETALMAGRFAEAWVQATNLPVYRVYPSEVAIHFCGRTGRGITKDVVQAAIKARWAVEGNHGKGHAKNPGKLYGIANHSISALGVAVTKAEGGAGDFPCPFSTAKDEPLKYEPLFTEDEYAEIAARTQIEYENQEDTCST